MVNKEERIEYARDRRIISRHDKTCLIFIPCISRTNFDDVRVTIDEVNSSLILSLSLPL